MSLLNLTQQISPKAYPVELIAGIYHVVWSEFTTTSEKDDEDEDNDGQFGDGEIIRYSEDIPKFISISQAEEDSNGTMKREPETQGSQSYQIIYRVGIHDLIYGLTFTDSVSTRLVRLSDSLTDWGPTARIHFGIVHDDQGFPFLKFRANYTDSSNYSNILESVSKKTDLSGLYSKDLTKNEKLRLGFPIPEDKATRPRPVADESPREIMRVLGKYTHATAIQIAKVQTLRGEMNNQLRTSRAVLQDAVNLSLDVPADAEPEDRQAQGRQPKRKRSSGRFA